MENFWLAPDPFQPATRPGGGVAEPGDVIGALFEQQRLVENSNSAHEALVDAYEEWRRRFKAGTGQEAPPNPLMVANIGNRLDPEGPTPVEAARTRFAQFMSEQAARFPADAAGDWAQFDPAAYAIELARGADENAARLMESRPGWDKFIYMFAGAGAASLRDPLQVGSLALGGGPGGARTAIGRILTTAASEAGVNAVSEAAIQPAVQEWRARAGLDAGWDQALANIGFAAAFGGFLGAGGRSLAEGAAMLASPLRGAAQAGDMLALVDAQIPDGFSPGRHELALSHAEAQLRAVSSPEARPLPAQPMALDDMQVNRIVDAMAPERVDGYAPNPESFAETLTTIRGGIAAASAGPSQRPVMREVARIGGVDPDGPMADELRAMGLTAQDMPGLFRKGGHSDLDNIPVDEMRAAFGGRSDIDDGNGYVSRQAFIDALAEEQGRRPGGDISAERTYWESRGVDFAGMRDADILARMADISEAEARWTAAGPQARLDAANAVRQALEMAGGTAPDRAIRAAVDLHLNEGEDLRTALDWAMSDMAGVSRTLPAPAAEFDGLGSRPPEAMDELPDELMADWERDMEALVAWADEEGLGDLAVPFGDELMTAEGIRQSIDRAAQLERVVAVCRL